MQNSFEHFFDNTTNTFRANRALREKFWISLTIIYDLQPPFGNIPGQKCPAFLNFATDVIMLCRQFDVVYLCAGRQMSIFFSMALYIGAQMRTGSNSHQGEASLGIVAARFDQDYVPYAQSIEVSSKPLNRRLKYREMRRAA
jgi:hypothetical protein